MVIRRLLENAPWLVTGPPIVGTLALGAVGGWAFERMTMPIPWMTGAMCVTTVAAVAGAPLRASGRLRGLMMAVLGIMLGGAFTPEVLHEAGGWPASLVALLLFIVFVVVTIVAVLRRIAGFDLATAYFSAAPGGLSQMVLLGGAMGGDDRTIALVQTMRIMLAVLLISFWFRFIQGYVPGDAPGFGSLTDVAPTDALILIACAPLGYWLANRLRVPAAIMVGPMMLSVAVHLSGLTGASPPDVVVNSAQVVLGASIGARFAAVSVRRVLGTLLLGSATTLYMMAIAVVFALVLEQALGFPFAALLLAFGPGGVAEMTLISLATGTDTAFVSTHHVVRLFIIFVGAPIAYRLFSGRRAEAGSGSKRTGGGGGSG